MVVAMYVWSVAVHLCVYPCIFLHLGVTFVVCAYMFLHLLASCQHLSVLHHTYGFVAYDKRVFCSCTVCIRLSTGLAPPHYAYALVSLYTFVPLS